MDELKLVEREVEDRGERRGFLWRREGLGFRIYVEGLVYKEGFFFCYEKKKERMNVYIYLLFLLLF